MTLNTTKKISLETYYKSPDELVAGLDEAGQGPLFGRVYVAAVILNPSI